MRSLRAFSHMCEVALEREDIEHCQGILDAREVPWDNNVLMDRA